MIFWCEKLYILTMVKKKTGHRCPAPNPKILALPVIILLVIRLIAQCLCDEERNHNSHPYDSEGHCHNLQVFAIQLSQ